MSGDQRHGFGVLHKPGRVMCGKWHNDVLSGQARVSCIDKNGYRIDYCGELLDGVYSGEGVAILHEAIYIGQFEIGEFQGEGMHIDAHNSVYHGQWKDGKRHGAGTRGSLGGEWTCEHCSTVTSVMMQNADTLSWQVWVMKVSGSMTSCMAKVHFMSVIALT